MGIQLPYTELSARGQTGQKRQKKVIKEKMGCTFASLAAFGAASANGDLFVPRRSDEAAAQWIRACNENASIRGAPLLLFPTFFLSI